MSRYTHDEHKEIFGNGSHQISKSKINGRVRVNLIENVTKSIYYEEVAAKMQEDIQSCLDNGFKFSDITILCRGNFDIFSFSQLLGNLKVNYHGEEVYIKTISESVSYTHLDVYKRQKESLINKVNPKWEIAATEKGFKIASSFSEEIKNIMNQLKTEE